MSNRPRSGPAGVQPPRRARRSRRAWTKRRREAFLETLAETCNVSEAARVAGMDRSSAYDLKNRDPEFQRGWGKALEQAYSALEWSLLKDAREGSVRTEMTLDPETRKPTSIKLTRMPAHTVAIRLYLSHKAEVSAFRAAEAAMAESLAANEREWLEAIDATLATIEHAQAQSDFKPGGLT